VGENRLISGIFFSLIFYQHLFQNKRLGDKTYQMKMKWFILSGLLLGLISCSKNEDRILLRVRNVSSEDFKNVRLYDQSMGDIDAGQTTFYKEFETAYHIAYVEAEIKGVKTYIVPIDYIGEPPLENGKYTFEIGINPLA
jgi:hypothetical protein